MLAGGKTVAQVIQHLTVSEQTYHRWRTQFGGMKSEEAKRLPNRFGNWRSRTRGSNAWSRTRRSTSRS